MSLKRQRQRELIGQLVFNIFGFLFFGLCLIIFIYAASAPELRDKPLIGPLEPILGHAGTLIFGIIVSLIFVILGLAFAIRAVRLLRNPAYLERKPPTWEDFM